MHVLYINLWGTTAKIPEETIIECQTYFDRTLTELCLELGLNGQSLGDYGYVFGESLLDLTALASRLFQKMCFVRNTNCLWPLRAAIANGAIQVGSRWCGPATVFAAELEKSAQKGMRLLIDRRCESLSENTRTIDVRGTTHFEYNWMRAGDWLTVDRQTRLQAIASEWMNEGSNYSQQMASSLLGLLRWSASTSV